MSEHPIQGLMKTAMESIKDMVDVNTIVGDAVETPDGTIIIPISRVSFGFAAGGGNCEPENIEESKAAISFGGGSGAGVSVKPVGFLVCSAVHGVRFMPVEGNVIYDRLIDLVPKVLTKIQEMLENTKSDSMDDMDELAETAETQGK
ncbi:GerW family sporulation protein [Pelosinus sp. UFO1]|uniref:GerW family sporulation protein n=1 Tax=Pelosinus sp. UFO1 TaxID=484770 RepID=UPI0004D1D1FF|nr:GerW family sporulation protein [Pelosinus sp. UFO1]AIF51538.1 sporulation protein YtfJ [Pelosinus sp. UFO1]